MKVLTREDVDGKNLWRFLLYGWLPIPHSVIPPKRPRYLWSELSIAPYDATRDYNGKLLDEIRASVLRGLEGWGSSDRIGVWLSGGVDSSALLYLMSEVVGCEKVRAFCLTFGKQDESEYAKRVADSCNVKLVMKEMTPRDSIGLTEEAVLCMRAPIHSTEVLYISKLSRHDGTSRVLSALGLDEIMGGYPQHVHANNGEFFRTETKLLWRCQSYYVWLQLLQSQKYVAVRFPFLDTKLIAFCRGLPRAHKCTGWETKIRLRKELSELTNLPKENIEAGRIAGTKAGFTPILEDWFERGYDDWCKENIVPRAFGIPSRAIVRLICNMGRSLEGRLQRTLRVAALNTFYDLLDRGEFNLTDSGSDEDRRACDVGADNTTTSIRRYSD